ncbi:expressed unknown protein [Seminavis robusta]|uniref:EGF-like domain-containing protein n=1 Tax=Seminavis robusta TaxID=568900 RepID=A0A9N8E0E7_9STRA|nr:expressed unknown protein [Seminavis robusta]|eukprot:Sro525_g160090.1 n/a (1341) ;mRNA; f:9569-13895
MTTPHKHNKKAKEEGMTLPPTKKSQSHPLLQVKDEVDVDSFMMDLEQPQKSPTESLPMSSFTVATGASALMESLTPKDLEMLANLLNPIMRDQSENKEEHALPTPTMNSAGEEDKKDDSEWHTPYSDSTYSLFYLCSVDSLAFWYAVFVYVIQITTILLTLIDIVDWGGAGLKMPPNVDLSVTIAQGVALFQAIAFQSDLLEVVAKSKDGFHPEVLEKHPGATYATWLLSCIAQLIAGLLLLLTIYILTMQVDSVLGIMLNFAALHFMADIDDAGFSLAKAGFMGNRLQHAANDVTDFQVRKASVGQGFLQRSWKAGVFLLILVVMVAGWITIVVFRTSGKFMCNTIIVNMGDNFVPSLGTFNGLYDFDFLTGSGLEWRAEYVERRSVEIDTPGKGVFGYCNDINAWTFRVQPKDNQEDSDPCDWIARSSETHTYDITETGSIQWFVRDETNREVVLEPFSLFCFDCSNEDADGSDDCGGLGTCSNAVCACDDGWYGLRCEFVSPCSWINIDARTEKFASTRDWASSYQSIDLGNGTLVEAYHRPVYIHEYENGEFDAVMFTGGRWALTSSVFLPHAGRIPSNALSDGQDDLGSDIGNYFTHAFHGYKGFSTNYSIAFLSDYIAMGTHLSSSSPVGFSWFFTEEARDQNMNQGIGNEITTKFLCHTCEESSNPCLYDGKCLEGECVCSLDSFGSLCEVPPVHNGHCNPVFNIPEFKMDGGDCCESTCVSTSQYVCGAEEDGYVSIGYYYCKQQKDEWQSTLLNGDAGSFSGYALALAMESMAVSEPSQDRVRIYDKVGSSWILRDTILGSRFGDGYRTLRIYRCNSDGCTLSQEFPLVNAFALSDDGTVLVTSLFVLGQAPQVIRIYEAQETSFEFRADLNRTRNGTLAGVHSLSLSGDGSRMAVQTQMTGIDLHTNFPIVTDANIVVMARDALTGDYADETEFRFETHLKYVDAYFPLSVALSQDGNVLGYGFPLCLDGQLHIQARNDEGEWVPRVSPTTHIEDCIDSERPVANNALSLSGDGSIIAFRVGSHVRVFEWQSEAESWNDVSGPFPLLHYPVSLSSSGRELAVGTPQEGIGGVTTVYSLPGRKECPTGMSLLRLSVTLDRFPGDVVWNLMDNVTGAILFEHESYPEEYAFATIVEEICILAEPCYVFTMYNRWQHGMKAPGQFSLFMDGEKVVHESFDGLFVKEYFGNCLSCPAGTERLNIMMLACEQQIPWELHKFIEATNDMDSTSSNYIYSSDPEDEREIPPLCSEYFDTENCTNWISYETCLDPTECYAFTFLSNLQALVEIFLGEHTGKPSVEELCGLYSFYFGNEEKCWTGNATIVHIQNDTLNF